MRHYTSHNACALCSKILQFCIATMSDICCLCVKEVHNRRKRKRLHSSSCAQVKVVLQELTPVPLDSLNEVSSPDAILCSNCESDASKILSLSHKVEGLKQGIRQKLHLISSHRSFNTATPDPKRPRMCVTPPQPAQSPQSPQPCSSGSDAIIEESPQVMV